MDPSALVGLIPTGSIAGILTLIIVYLLRQNNADRTQYAAAAVVQAKSAAQDRAEFRAEVAVLRKELGDSRDEAEAERRAKWAAQGSQVASEAEAAAYRRELDEIRRVRAE